MVRLSGSATLKDPDCRSASIYLGSGEKGERLVEKVEFVEHRAIFLSDFERINFLYHINLIS